MMLMVILPCVNINKQCGNDMNWMFYESYKER